MQFVAMNAPRWVSRLSHDARHLRILNLLRGSAWYLISPVI